MQAHSTPLQKRLQKELLALQNDPPPGMTLNEKSVQNTITQWVFVVACFCVPRCNDHGCHALSLNQLAIVLATGFVFVFFKSFQTAIQICFVINLIVLIGWLLISTLKKHKSPFYTYSRHLKFHLSQNRLLPLTSWFVALTWQLGESVCSRRHARTSKIARARDVVEVKRTQHSCSLCSACWGEIRVMLLTGSLAPFSRVSVVQCHYTSL